LFLEIHAPTTLSPEEKPQYSFEREMEELVIKCHALAGNHIPWLSSP
jgi:hypothetical protein